MGQPERLVKQVRDVGALQGELDRARTLLSGVSLVLKPEHDAEDVLACHELVEEAAMAFVSVLDEERLRTLIGFHKANPSVPLLEHLRTVFPLTDRILKRS